jgi:PKD repeat protein
MSRRLSVLSAAVVFFGLMACLSSVSCHKKSPTGPSGALGMVCSASPRSGQVPLPVQFTAKAQGLSDEDQRRVVYNWTLGDGSVATGPTVLKTYMQGGTFNVTMTATYGGDTAVWHTTITVDSDLRVESCSGQPASGNVPLAVQFQSRIVGNGQNPITYAWDFGDGGTAGDAQPSHTYRSAGSYTARLTAQSGGSSAHCSVPVGVFDSLGVTCSASPTSGDAPLTVSFDANANGGDNACTYSWDFDDGKMSSDQKSPTHRYDLGELHYPTVTVTCGTRRGSCSQKIKVIGALPTPTPGGGSGTPTPTPTATPTPAPTPTPTPCPGTGTRTFTGTGTPVTVPWPGGDRLAPVSVPLGSMPLGCRIQSIQYGLSVTSTRDLSAADNVAIYLLVNVPPSTLWGAGDDLAYQLPTVGTPNVPATLTGNLFGTGCPNPNLVFSSSSTADFATAVAPYDGTYAGFSLREVGGPVSDFVGITYALTFHANLSPFNPTYSITINCWNMVVTYAP